MMKSWQEHGGNNIFVACTTTAHFRTSFMEFVLFCSLRRRQELHSPVDAQEPLQSHPATKWGKCATSTFASTSVSESVSGVEGVSQCTAPTTGFWEMNKFLLKWDVEYFYRNGA